MVPTCYACPRMSTHVHRCPRPSVVLLLNLKGWCLGSFISIHWAPTGSADLTPGLDHSQSNRAIESTCASSHTFVRYDVPITFNLALPLCQAASSAQASERTTSERSGWALLSTLGKLMPDVDKVTLVNTSARSANLDGRHGEQGKNWPVGRRSQKYFL